MDPSTGKRAGRGRGRRVCALRSSVQIGLSLPREGAGVRLRGCDLTCGEWVVGGGPGLSRRTGRFQASEQRSPERSTWCGLKVETSPGTHVSLNTDAGDVTVPSCVPVTGHRRPDQTLLPGVRRGFPGRPACGWGLGEAEVAPAGAPSSPSRDRTEGEGRRDSPPFPASPPGEGVPCLVSCPRAQTSTVGSSWLSGLGTRVASHHRRPGTPAQMAGLRAVLPRAGAPPHDRGINLLVHGHPRLRVSAEPGQPHTRHREVRVDTPVYASPCALAPTAGGEGGSSLQQHVRRVSGPGVRRFPERRSRGPGRSA